jgi:hypothetical protein
LPPAITWPRNDDEPLSFIAQANLADVAAYDSEGVLPRDGLLSFFYDAVTQGAWGFDPADHGSAAVRCRPVPGPLQPVAVRERSGRDGRSALTRRDISFTGNDEQSKRLGGTEW